MKKHIACILVIIALLILNIFLIGKYVVSDNNDNNINISGDIQIPSGDDLIVPNEPDEVIKPDDSGDIKVPEVQKDPSEIVEKEEIVENKTNDEKEIDATYDVIVFGAEPEGIATAISAARNNKKVLMLERRDGPGGLMVYAMLNTLDMSYNFDRVLLTQGIFEEFFENFGSKDSFDVEEVRTVFETMIAAEENLTTIYNIEDYQIGSTGSEIKYVIADDKKYTADMYIDCTQDADITVAAGAESFNGWEDVNEYNRAMSATLVMKMEGVDWAKSCKAVLDANLPNSGYTEKSIWAFGEITKKYIPRQPHMRLKALNLGLQNDGSVLINSLQIINADMLNKKSKERAYEKCVIEAKYVAEFLSKNVPGFENAKLTEVAPELYVRETRHIIGEDTLTVKDILESTYSYHAIAMSSYPIDIQTLSIYDWGYIIGTPDQYYLTLGMIIPKGFTNLMTVGRSGSYTSIASGSARVMPTGMALGEAAGVVAAVCIEKDINLQEILEDYSARRDAQMRMKLQGMYLDTESKPVVDKDGQYYDFIIEMCELGILSLGYQNEFDADAFVSEREFIVLTKTYLKRNFLNEEFWNTDHINLLDTSENPITANRAKEIMYDITTFNVKDEETREMVEDYIELVAPEGNENLTVVRVYEILRYLKDFLIKEVK